MDTAHKNDDRRQKRLNRSQVMMSLEARCRELGITNKELAQFTGISESKISRAFNGYQDLGTLDAEQIHLVLIWYAEERRAQAPTTEPQAGEISQDEEDPLRWYGESDVL